MQAEVADKVAASLGGTMVAQTSGRSQDVSFSDAKKRAPGESFPALPISGCSPVNNVRC